VAALGEHGTTTDALLHAADSALYLAKEQGRDRVIIAGRSELPKGGASSLVASKGLR